MTCTLKLTGDTYLSGSSRGTFTVKKGESKKKNILILQILLDGCEREIDKLVSSEKPNSEGYYRSFSFS